MDFDNERIKSDANYAKDFFAGEDVNSANKKLSEAGAKINQLEIIILLANALRDAESNSSSSTSTSEFGSEKPASQLEAEKLGKEAEERAEQEAKEKSEASTSSTLTPETSTSETPETKSSEESKSTAETSTGVNLTL